MTVREIGEGVIKFRQNSFSIYSFVMRSFLDEKLIQFNSILYDFILSKFSHIEENLSARFLKFKVLILAQLRTKLSCTRRI